MSNGWFEPAFVLVVFAAIGVAASVLAQRIRRKRPAEVRNDDLILYLTVSAALLGAYLGFLSVSVWETHMAAETSSQRESADLMVLYRLSSTYPVETRAELQADIIRYARSIAEVEWPRMAQGDVADLFNRSPELQSIWTTVLSAAASGVPYGSIAVDRLSALTTAREIRLLSSMTEVSSYIWFTISVGAALNFGLLLLMRIERGALHTVMMTCFASWVGITLWGLYDMQTPYVGSWCISAKPFEQAVKQMEAVPRVNVR